MTHAGTSTPPEVSTTEAAPAAASVARPRPHPSDPVPHGPVGKTSYRRGDVWYVVEDPARPPVGTELWANRPAVIVSNNVSSNRSGFVQMIFLTTSTSKRTGPTHVPLGDVLGDGRETMALCEQIHTVDVSRLTRRKGYVPRHHMGEIDAAIMFSLSIRHSPDEFALYRKWEQHVKLHGVDMAAEIEALSARTTDERVTALTRALEAAAAQRDAYRQLYESAVDLPSLLDGIQTSFSGPTEEDEEKS